MKLMNSEESRWSLHKASISMKEIIDADKMLDEKFTNLDAYVQQVIDAHEYEFMQAYNIYVKRKEKELIEIILDLESRNTKNNLMD